MPQSAHFPSCGHDGAVRCAEPTYAAGSTTSDSQAERAARSAEQNAPAGGKAVYCLSDSEREFAGVVRLDLAGLRVDAIAQPEHEVEYVAESRDGRYLAWVVNLGGANQIMLRDMRAGTTRQAPGLPTGVISPAPDVSGLVFAPDGARIAFSFSTPRRSRSHRLARPGTARRWSRGPWG